MLYHAKPRTTTPSLTTVVTPKDGGIAVLGLCLGLLKY